MHKSQSHPVSIVSLSNTSLTEYAIQLAKKHREELGAVHCGVISGILQLGVGTLRISTQNDEPASMVLTRHGLASDPRCMPIIAAAVQSDARRMHHGLALLDAIIDDGFSRGRSFIQAICRADLPSNRFWAAAGFTPIAVRTNGSTRKKACIIWRRPIADMSTSILQIERTKRAQGGGGRFVRLKDISEQLRLYPATNEDNSGQHVFEQAAEPIARALEAAGIDLENRVAAMERFATAVYARALGRPHAD